jgi:hypothetical protein
MEVVGQNLLERKSRILPPTGCGVLIVVHYGS